MSVARGYAAAMWGVVRAQIAIFVSYRGQVLTQIFGTVFSLALFYYLSRLLSVSAFDSPDDYFAFVVVGLVILQVLQSTFGAPAQVNQELVAGTFERLAVSPLGPVGGTIAMLVFPLFQALVGGVVTVALAALIFGMPVHWSTAWLAGPAAVLGALAFAPIALGFAALVLAFKRQGGVTYVLTAVTFVSGLYFPVTLLPGWIQWTSEVQPFTPAVELLRHLIVDLPTQNRPIVDVLKLIGFIILLTPLSLWLLRRAVSTGRKRGTLTEY